MNKHPFRFLSLAAAVVVALATAAARADTLASWKLVNTASGTTDFPDALTVGDVTSSAAVSGTSGPHGYSASGWPKASFSSNTYFQFTVTATDDYNLALSDLVMNLRSTKDGPSHAEIRHSLNGTSWITDATFIVPTNSSANYYNIDCSRITVLGGQTLTVRIYAWGANTANGTFRLGNDKTMNLSGNAVGTKQAPTIVFPHSAESVAVSNKLTVDIGVLPAGSGLTKTWSFLPKPAGKYALSGKRFTFTPAMADEGGIFTLSVTATNSYGTNTATLAVAVTEYMPPGSWFTGFETGDNPNYRATNSVIDERAWRLQELAFLSSDTIPKVGARACVFGRESEAYMVSADPVLSSTHGFGTLSFLYAEYPGDTEPCQPLIVEVATDLAAGNWMELGSVNPNGVDTLTRADFPLATSEPVYLRIRTGYVNGSGRVVIDQLSVTPFVAPAWTPFEQYLLKYNVTPGDPGCASENYGTTSTYQTDDFDEDGYSNWAEFNATPQTNPYDKTSHP